MKIYPSLLRTVLIMLAAATLATATLDAAPRRRTRKKANPAATATTVKADTLPQQTMTIERDFVPVVRDADKLSRQPAIEQPSTHRTTPSYADWTARTAGDTLLTRLPVGQVFADEPFDSSKGYVDGNIGNYWNTNVHAGYRILETDETRLSVRAGFHLTSGELEMNRRAATGAKFPDWKNTQSAGLGAVTLTRDLDDLLWTVEAGYCGTRHDLMNRRFLNAGSLGATFPRIKQKTGDLHASVTFDNHNRGQRIQYTSSLLLENFSWDCPDGSELQARLRSDVEWDVWQDYTGGVRAEITALHYSFSDRNGQKYKPLKSGVQISLAPYLLLDFDELHIDLGARADFISGPDSHFGIAPAAHATYDLPGQGGQIFADATGGLQRACQRLVMEEMPFYVPVHQYKNPWTVTDATLGYRNHTSGDLHGELFVGAAYTLDALIPYAIEDAAYGMTTRIGNADDLRIKFGGKLAYTYNKYFAATAAITAYAHTEEEAASHEPSYEVIVAVTSSPVKELQLTLTYHGLYDRYAWFIGSGSYGTRKVALGDYSGLDIKGSWQWNNRLRFYAEVDNILCEDYDVWFGVPGQRLNAHIGASWSF